MPLFVSSLAMPCVLWSSVWCFLVDDIFWHLGFKSAEHAEKVMRRILNYCDYCIYCDYFYCFRLESIMASLSQYGSINATPLQKRFVIWVQNTVRFCVMAGSTTSRRKMVLADRGRVLGGSKQLYEARLLWMMKRRFCCSQAAICPVERLPSPRCATVPSWCEGFWNWSKPTNLLLARKSNNYRIITNNYHQIIIK